MKSQVTQNARTSINEMKKAWARAKISPYRFFSEFYSPRSHQTYFEFLELINFWERYPAALSDAFESFLKANFKSI